MKSLFPRCFELPEEPASPAQTPLIDGNPTLSPAGVMYSTLLQLRTLVETEKLERKTLKQLVHRLQRDFALLQPQIEPLEQPTTSKSSSFMTLEKKFRVLEKCLSTETCRYNSKLNSLQHQLSTMGDQLCQFEQSNSNFILWKVTSNLYLSLLDYGTCSLGRKMLQPPDFAALFFALTHMATTFF